MHSQYGLALNWIFIQPQLFYRFMHNLLCKSQQAIHLQHCFSYGNVTSPHDKVKHPYPSIFIHEPNALRSHGWLCKLMKIKAAVVFGLSFFAQKPIRRSWSRATGCFFRVFFKAASESLCKPHLTLFSRSSSKLCHVSCPRLIRMTVLTCRIRGTSPLIWYFCRLWKLGFIELQRANIIKQGNDSTVQLLKVALLQKVSTWNFFSCNQPTK